MNNYFYIPTTGPGIICLVDMIKFDRVFFSDFVESSMAAKNGEKFEFFSKLVKTNVLTRNATDYSSPHPPDLV